MRSSFQFQKHTPPSSEMVDLFKRGHLKDIEENNNGFVWSRALQVRIMCLAFKENVLAIPFTWQNEPWSNYLIRWEINPTSLTPCLVLREWYGCLFVCLSVTLSHSVQQSFCPHFPKSIVQTFLYIQNPWGKVMERSVSRFEHCAHKWSKITAAKIFFLGGGFSSFVHSV